VAIISKIALNFNMFCDIRWPSMRCTVSAYNLVDSIIFCIFVTEINKDMSYEKEGLIVDDGFDVGAGLSGNGCYWS
jgi:hypothetical protein